MQRTSPSIRFKLEPEKLVAALAFFASKTRGLDKLKAAKLLYYADKYHLTQYGRPILGDVYFRLDYGPVPSKSLDIMNEAIDPHRVRGVHPDNQMLISKYLRTNSEGRHPTFELKHEPDMKVFSESEIEALVKTVEKYGHFTGSKLIDLTHRDATWNKTERNGEIDYRLFFDDAKGANPEALEYMESLRENVEVMSLLAAPAR